MKIIQDYHNLCRRRRRRVVTQGKIRSLEQVPEKCTYCEPLFSRQTHYCTWSSTEFTWFGSMLLLLVPKKFIKDYVSLFCKRCEDTKRQAFWRESIWTAALLLTRGNMYVAVCVYESRLTAIYNKFSKALFSDNYLLPHLVYESLTNHTAI